MWRFTTYLALALSLAGNALAAQDPRVAIVLRHDGNDAVGQSLYDAVRQELRRSKRYAAAPEAAGFVVELSTVAVGDGRSAVTLTVARSAIETYRPEQALRTFEDTLSAQQVEELAKDIVAAVHEELDTFLATRLDGLRETVRGEACGASAHPACLRLVDLAASQELYYAESGRFTYTDDWRTLEVFAGLQLGSGIEIVEASAVGWAAVLSDDAVRCALFYGAVDPVAPATDTEVGVVVCEPSERAAEQPGRAP